MGSAACRTTRSPSPVPPGVSIQAALYMNPRRSHTLISKLADPRGNILVPGVNEIVPPPDDKESCRALQRFFFLGPPSARPGRRPVSCLRPSFLRVARTTPFKDVCGLPMYYKALSSYSAWPSHRLLTDQVAVDMNAYASCDILPDPRKFASSQELSSKPEIGRVSLLPQ
ncbi:hypothetical protein BC826DRAFT_575963 [Russula brevipes]|nr:hypothetical protein BC826DRAFT_575963 [Russula brevipes]